GTVTTPGTYPLDISVADSAGHTASATLDLVASPPQTIPASVVHDSIYSGLFFAHLGYRSDVESIVLQQAVNRTYTANPGADPTAVENEIASLRRALESAGGTQLSGFGPSLQAQVAGAIGVYTKFVAANPTAGITPAAGATASSLYAAYLAKAAINTTT